jgi:hypothetical protein
MGLFHLGSITVVIYSPQYLKVKGLSPVTAAGTGRDEKVKALKDLHKRFKQSNFAQLDAISNFNFMVICK